jgi:predicted Zn finger-like uncharacterized protein
MKITCESCQSKYTVADEKVQGKTAKIRCKKCGATILVNASGAVAGAAAAGAEGAAPAAEAPGEPSYMVNVADGDQRSMTLAEIVAAYNEGRVDGETFVWADGMSDWQALAGVEAIVAALHAHTGTPSTAAPVMTATEEPLPPAALEPAPEPAPAPRAALRREAARGSTDLFGGGGGFGDDVATSAPVGPAATPSKPGLTGQRDENSMLFSLSALTAKVPSVPPARPATTETTEDSGLIDLRALGAASGPQSQASDLLPDSAALFPLGAPAAPPPPSQAPGVMALPTQAPAPKSKAPMFVGVSAIVAVAAVAGAFFLSKKAELPPPAAPVVAATVASEPKAPEPPPTAEPAASATQAAADPGEVASAAPSASAVARAPTPGGRAPVGGGKAPPAPTGAGTTPGAKPTATTPAAPPKPSKGNCGCAPGDLMCAMRCSAGK